MSQNLVIAARFINSVEADLFASELRSMGIECVIIDQDTARMNIQIAMVNGGIRVMVAEKDAETAAELYGQSYKTEESKNRIGTKRIKKIVWLYIAGSVLFTCLIYVLDMLF